MICEALAMMLEVRDPYTAGHQRRVAQLAGAIGLASGLDVKELGRLRISGPVHDIGKIAVPAEILAKPAKLSVCEFGIVKTHPQVGANILTSIGLLDWPDIAEIALQHHERLDGSGYPKGLMGEQISRAARILAVADVVEAMCSHRPYRAALGVQKALHEIIRGKGALYDAEVVKVCGRLFRSKGFQFAERQ